jgi:hypothetical protein
MKTSINFRIEKESKDELQLIANDQGLQLSAVIRDILNDYLDYYQYEEFDDFLIKLRDPNYIKLKDREDVFDIETFFK